MGQQRRLPDWRRPAAADIPVGARLVLAFVGATPVSLIGLSTFGVVGLKTLAIAVLVPGLGALSVIVARNRVSGSMVTRGVAAGLIATLLYDMIRWWFLGAGWMDRDPIPHIGTSLDLAPGWLFGYLWRFVGNGGGLAVVFVVSGARGIVRGVAFGLLVCSGLFGVLVFSPHGQDVLFPLVPATIVVAVVGHVVYGAVLGALSVRLIAPSRRGRSRARVARPRMGTSRRTAWSASPWIG